MTPLQYGAAVNADLGSAARRSDLVRGAQKPRSLAGLTWASVGALGGIRTPNLLIRSQMLYPLSYERRASESLA